MKVRLRSGVVFWLAVLLLLGLWKVEGVVLEKSVLLEDQHVDQQQVLYFEYSPTEDANVTIQIEACGEYIFDVLCAQDTKYPSKNDGSCQIKRTVSTLTISMIKASKPIYLGVTSSDLTFTIIAIENLPANVFTEVYYDSDSSSISVRIPNPTGMDVNVYYQTPSSSNPAITNACLAKKYGTITTGVIKNSTYPVTEFFISGLSTNQTMDVVPVINSPYVLSLTAKTIKTQILSECYFLRNLTLCGGITYPIYLPNGYTQAKEMDENAQDNYDAFARALSMYNCEQIPYSFVRNCTDCQKAYIDWICSTTMPRCSIESRGTSTLPDDYLSLPCIETCVEVVLSCPTSVLFTCPLEDTYSYYHDYRVCSSSQSNFVPSKTTILNLSFLSLILFSIFFVL